MKFLLAMCVLAFAVAFLEAEPRGLRLNDPQLLGKGVGDIWTNCTKPGDQAQIDKVVIVPDPPEKGKNVTVTAVVTLFEEVTKGNVKVEVKVGFIPVFSQNYDLCTLAKEAGNPCPVQKGKLTATVSEPISSLPSLTVNGNVEVTDQNGDELVCVNFKLTL